MSGLMDKAGRLRSALQQSLEQAPESPHAAARRESIEELNKMMADVGRLPVEVEALVGRLVDAVLGVVRVVDPLAEQVTMAAAILAHGAAVLARPEAEWDARGRLPPDPPATGETEEQQKTEDKSHV